MGLGLFDELLVALLLLLLRDALGGLLGFQLGDEAREGLLVGRLDVAAEAAQEAVEFLDLDEARGDGAVDFEVGLVKRRVGGARRTGLGSASASRSSGLRGC